MRLLKWMWENFKVGINPGTWMRNYGYSKHVDKFILTALENPKFEYGNPYTQYDNVIKLNGVTVWVGNYPYAYGYLYNRSQVGMPSRKTVVKLKKALDAHIVKEVIKGTGNV